MVTSYVVILFNFIPLVDFFRSRIYINLEEHLRSWNKGSTFQLTSAGAQSGACQLRSICKFQWLWKGIWRSTTLKTNWNYIKIMNWWERYKTNLEPIIPKKAAVRLENELFDIIDIRPEALLVKHLYKMFSFVRGIIW